ncbi:MAG: multicopper oxidase domain-containing protein [Acidimicrobiia bacterium]
MTKRLMEQPATEQTRRRPLRPGDLVTWGVAGLALVVALGAMLATTGGPRDFATDGGVTAAPETTVTTSDQVLGTIEVVASEFAFEPSRIEVDAPGRYEISLRNDGDIIHDFAAGDTVIVAEAGATAVGVVEVPPSGLEVICSIPGHVESGMTGMITVAGSDPVAAAEDMSHGSSAVAPSVEPDPAAPPYEPFDPRAPQRGEGPGITLIEGGAPGGGDLIEVEMMIEEKVMTIAEGFSQEVWTFGGTLPGPVIRTHVGDTVRVHLVNPETSVLPHSVDFHASQVAWNDEMRSINPGEDLMYEFTTDYAGVWMYHCGTPPVLHHISNGMYGMVIVEPEGGLPPMEHEFAILQSEWYLGPQGEPSDLIKADQGAPSPDLVLFNGVAFQYEHSPIEIPTGEQVRIFVLNAGPSIDSAFHVVGTIFDTVIREGVSLERGNPGNYGSQAVDLSPSQGAIVEMKAMEDGLYPIVTHAFNFPGRGALGLFQAGDGDPS